MRILLLVAAIVGVFLIVRTLLRSSGKGAPAVPPERVKQQGPVVRCAHCGVHVPHLEAYRAGERVYCSREHALEDARSRDDD
ncbi:hypothetical protein TVNIR_2514 [Thioalkalivibrio nitratireducens DSM 14787]|uniref:Preprotein translocase subunit YajC n=1 Tax=Thioalkalivibrio nitratireducens (strain DSM 14787 / UNIQEM 213 / ALEN2) TaxID=1255043 RepID=L0DYS6_THIND|nr:PP0621 family protein [Thioalkalivibrio nitratireducens]AGA34157.1 hypothetical protein TVNIR_2514 [Thioalkalivibrio nitratireducens DSM 14787]